MYTPKDPETDKLTRKQAILLNALANPEYRGNISAACRAVKMDRTQHYAWVRNSPAYREALEQQIRMFADAGLPEVWGSLIDSCVEDRDPKSIKLYMELTGRYQNNVNVTGNAGVVIMSGEDNIAK